MPRMTKAGWKRVLINAFILLHLYIIVAWGLPGSNFRYSLIRPIDDYVIYAGLWHSWDMFSPDPLSLNFEVEAVIKYENGAEKSWSFPRMEKLGIGERFQKERYRKWRERARLDMYSAAWDDTARYIARRHDTATNHPVQVTLIRRWAPIPAPATVTRGGKFENYQPMIRADLNFPFNYHYKFYDVKPGDL